MTPGGKRVITMCIFPYYSRQPASMPAGGGLPKDENVGICGFFCDPGIPPDAKDCRQAGKGQRSFDSRRSWVGSKGQSGACFCKNLQEW